MNGFPGPWIPACAGIAVFNRKGPESAQFHAVIIHKRVRDFFKDRIYDFFDISQEKVRIALCQFLNEFRFRHL